MKPGLCWLLGHGRGPVSDRIEVGEPHPSGYAEVTRFCGCCGKRANGFSLVRRHALLGQELPRGYGIAWVHWSSPTAVLMPIPFNLVAGLLYRLRWWTKIPRGLVDNPDEAYRQGLRDGQSQGLALARSLPPRDAP